MKKTLLTTTAIIAAFVATDANAGNLQVNVGGFADFQAANIDDDIVDLTANANDTDFNTDSEIHVSVEGAADNGLEYGAVVEVETNVGATGDTYDEGVNADKAYLFVQGGWGRVEAGENTGAEEALSVNTGSFASATGGVDGDFYRYIAAPTGSLAAVTDDATAEIMSDNFRGITKPKLGMAHSGTNSLTNEGADEDATKITYYSPRFAGFQVGASYVPNTGDTGRPGAAGTGTGDNEDLFSAGVNYTNQFDQVGVAASLTGISGSSKDAEANYAVAAGAGTLGTTATTVVITDAAQDIEGYAGGLNLTYAGFTVGGSYGDYQDTLGNFDSNYYDLGLGYAAGPFSVSATYLNSEVDRPNVTVNNGANAGVTTDDDILVSDSEFSNFVLGADYQLAPGLVPYAEVAFYEFEGGNTTTATDNDGTVVIVGTELSF